MGQRGRDVVGELSQFVGARTDALEPTEARKPVRQGLEVVVVQSKRY